MLNKIKALIDNEDRKNPLTDEEIAERLGIRREVVTQIRHQLNIEDSRKRRRPLLMQTMQAVLKKEKNCSDRKLTRLLQQQGFSVSRHLVKQLRQELSEPVASSIYTLAAEQSAVVSSRPKELRKAGIKERDRIPKTEEERSYHSFDEIIGADGSLKPYIQQAKAAVLYPPNGLHTLLLGPTGVGKSQLAEAMYFFAIESQRLDKSAPFIVFNCADYAENPQLLMAQLFGSVKGSYTGADRDREGLIEKANGGILFLDEVHRLPPEGQELLFYIIDKGKFRRLGETASQRSVNVMIICATSENPESSLLITFRRRIPMVIELPPLNERPISERHQVILRFFLKEANRTGAKMKIHSEVIRSLLLYDCPGNIGQLRSDIQVACARAFLRYVGTQRDQMDIKLGDLPEHTKRGLLYKKSNRLDLDQLVTRDVILSPNQENYHLTLYENLYSLPAEIYQHIENRFFELKRQGESKELINHIIGEELEHLFKKMMRRLEEHTRPMARKDLLNIVGVDVVEAVEKMIWIAEQRLDKSFERLYYGLAIHIHATLERMKQGKNVFNPHLEKVKEDYPREYMVAKEMADVINHYFQIHLPEDEIGFITMYLRSISNSQADDRKVGVVIVSHGSVASGMAEVANRLLGVNHARAVEMSLDEEPSQAYERTLEMVEEANEGKGVLLLVDMGSLVNFGDLIMEETGIPIKTIHRTNTVLVIESVRKAMLPDITLEELVESLDPDITFSIVKAPEQGRHSLRTRAVLTVCITGEGAAVALKEIVLQRIPQWREKIVVLPASVIHKHGENMMKEYLEQYEVIAVVGTVDPHLPSVPFISMADIVSGRGIVFLERLLEWSTANESPERKKHAVRRSRQKTNGELPELANLLDEELIFSGCCFNSKQKVLEFLFQKLKQKGYVSDDYYRRMLEREEMGSPMFHPETAIPHADPASVYHAAIAVAILNQPIEWTEGQYAKYIFMLALKENCWFAVQELYEKMQQKKVRDLLNSFPPPNEVLRIMTGECNEHYSEREGERD